MGSTHPSRPNSAKLGINSPPFRQQRGTRLSMSPVLNVAVPEQPLVPRGLGIKLRNYHKYGDDCILESVMDATSKSIDECSLEEDVLLLGFLCVLPQFYC